MPRAGLDVKLEENFTTYCLFPILLTNLFSSLESVIWNNWLLVVALKNLLTAIRYCLSLLSHDVIFDFLCNKVRYPEYCQCVILAQSITRKPTKWYNCTHPHLNHSESSLIWSGTMHCIAIATDSAAHQPPHTTAALKMTSSVVQCSFVHINSDCTVHTQVVDRNY